MLKSKYIVLNVSVNSHMYNLSTSFIPLRMSNHKGMTLGFHKLDTLGYDIFSRCDFEDTGRGSFTVLLYKQRAKMLTECSLK